MASTNTSSVDRGSDGLQGPAGPGPAASPVSSPIKRNARLAEQVDSAMPKMKCEKGKKKVQINTAVPKAKHEKGKKKAQTNTVARNMKRKNQDMNQTDATVPETKRKKGENKVQADTTAPVAGKKRLRILLSTKTFKWVKNAAGDWIKVPTQAPARKLRIILHKSGEITIKKEGEQQD